MNYVLALNRILANVLRNVLVRLVFALIRDVSIRTLIFIVILRKLSIDQRHVTLLDIRVEYAPGKVVIVMLTLDVIFLFLPVLVLAAAHFANDTGVPPSGIKVVEFGLLVSLLHITGFALRQLLTLKVHVVNSLGRLQYRCQRWVTVSHRIHLPRKQLVPGFRVLNELFTGWQLSDVSDAGQDHRLERKLNRLLLLHLIAFGVLLADLERELYLQRVVLHVQIQDLVRIGLSL